MSRKKDNEFLEYMQIVLNIQYANNFGKFDIEKNWCRVHTNLQHFDTKTINFALPVSLKAKRLQKLATLHRIGYGFYALFKESAPHPFLHHIKEFNIPAGGSSPHRAQIELLFKNSLLFTISIPFVGDSSERASSREIIAYVCAP